MKSPARNSDFEAVRAARSAAHGHPFTLKRCALATSLALLHIAAAQAQTANPAIQAQCSVKASWGIGPKGILILFPEYFSGCSYLFDIK